MLIVSETFLYLCFSFLFGTFILYAVREDRRPDIQVPKWLLLFSVIGIGILSFAPVLQTMLNLGQSLGFWRVFQPVLTSFEIGKAWIFTLVLSALLFLLIYMVNIRSQKPFLYLALGLLVILVLSQGWASHSKTIEQWKGLVLHSTHFLAVTVWVGIVLIAGWFSSDTKRWRSFLAWFTPVAILCVVLATFSGLLVMNISLAFRDYATSWVLPYGQAILLKHLFIIPTLVFAFINGFLIKKRLRLDESYNPLPWTKAEGLLLLFVFSVTAALGQQAPPHVISQTLQFVEPSALYQWFHPGAIDPNIVLNPSLTLGSFIFIVLSFGLLGCIIYLFKKKARPALAIGTSLLFVLTTYMSLMLAV